MKALLLLAAAIFCFSNFTNAQAGYLDPSFGNHGVVKTDLGVKFDYGAGPATKLLLHSDGSLYAVQGGEYHSNAVSKRLPDGSADTSFGIKGTIKGVNYSIGTAAVQSDGKIVTAGSATLNGTSAFAVARYNTNGSLDSSFAGDGIQITHISSVNTGDNYSTYERADLIAVQKDGKIIIAGLSSHNLYLVRYNTDGGLDSTFNGDGLLQGPSYYIDDDFSDPTPTVLAIQDDGKIIAGGGGDRGGYGNQSIIRYNTDGSRDTSFSVTTNYNIVSLAIQKDGKLVAAGNSITRYNMDGSVDKTFGNGGRRKIPWGCTSVAIQNNGKIVIVQNKSGASFHINRYNTDGSTDSSFAQDGKQETQFNLSCFVTTVAVQSDGKIVAGGGRYEGYDENYNKFAGFFALARYDKDGNLDNTFNKDGKLIDSTAYAGNTVYNQIKVQKDGKILAAGTTWNGRELVSATVRYNTNGSLDSIFSNNINIIPGSNTAIQKDGKTVSVVGNIVSRYNTDGSLDKTFGTDGHQTLNFTITGGSSPIDFVSLVIQSDEKIVLATHIGFYPSYIAIARLNTNGSVDSTFGKDGFTIIENKYDQEIFGSVYSCSLIIQNDDKAVVGADLDNSGFWLTRFNVDGSIDSTFNETPDREFIQRFGVNNSVTSSLALQSDGKIVAGGSVLLRYNTDGSVDSTFNINAYQQIDFAIRDIAISDNKLYVAGGGYFGAVARYLLDNDSSNTPPTVTLTAPANNATYLAPAARIRLSAAASDSDGTITKVEFYKDSTLLHTETLAPYGYNWRNVSAGNYTITAKAYDNSGNVTTSAPVHIVVNKPPIVSIIAPANKQSYAAPAYIHFEAAASDNDGRVTRVEFYNGSTLLRTEYKYPYTYVWKDVPRGTYTITAVATDNYGAQTTSEPINVKVTSARAIVSSRPYSENEKTTLNDPLSLRLSPNPATSVINIQTSGLQQNKPATLSIISLAGIVFKTMRISNAATQLDVSSLTSGVYMMKLISGEKVMYKKFVKL